MELSFFFKNATSRNLDPKLKQESPRDPSRFAPHRN